MTPVPTPRSAKCSGQLVHPTFNSSLFIVFNDCLETCLQSLTMTSLSFSRIPLPHTYRHTYMIQIIPQQPIKLLILKTQTRLDDIVAVANYSLFYSCRRYREFISLRARLEKSARYHKALKAVSSPSWWDQVSLKPLGTHEVEKRRAGLEKFLRGVSLCLNISDTRIKVSDVSLVIEKCVCKWLR